MNKIKNWIKRNQVAAFFIGSYAITWPGLFLIYFIFPGNSLVAVLSMPLAVYSPALTASLISGIADSQPKYADSRRRWLTFILSWIVCTAILVLYGWKLMEIPLPVNLVIHSLWALLPALAISSAFARNPGIRKLFETLLKPRGAVIWYLVIFLIFPGIVLLAFGITRLFGGQAEFFLADLGISGAATYLILEFLRGFITTGGINEETGWRGFALPRLQSRYPVIVSVGIVWFFWSAWHLPYDFGEGVPIEWIIENRLLWNLVFSILMSWLYNRTKGSLLAPALFHPAMNTFGNTITFTLAAKILFISLAVFAIIYDRMWERLPPDNLAVLTDPIHDNFT
jgi:membrane protease YdiL (CAAX protease family)